MLSAAETPDRTTAEQRLLAVLRRHRSAPSASASSLQPPYRGGAGAPLLAVLAIALACVLGGLVLFSALRPAPVTGEPASCHVTPRDDSDPALKRESAELRSELIS